MSGQQRTTELTASESSIIAQNQQLTVTCDKQKNKLDEFLCIGWNVSLFTSKIWNHVEWNT